MSCVRMHIAGSLSRLRAMSAAMRVLGIDLGQRRIGLAVSDVSETLARPLTTLTVRPNLSANRGGRSRDIAEIAQLDAEDDRIGTIVVGMPGHLDGTASDQTRRVAAFIERVEESHADSGRERRRTAEQPRGRKPSGRQPSATGGNERSGSTRRLRQSSCRTTWIDSDRESRLRLAPVDI